MQRFELFAKKWNIDIRCSRLANDIALTRFYDYVVISYDRDLSKEEAIVGVAMMIGALELGWEGRRFYFRFPVPEDELEDQERAKKAKRDYRRAFRWASERLIPDQAIEAVCKEERNPMELVELLCVTPELLQSRLRRWTAARQDVVFLYPGA